MLNIEDIRKRLKEKPIPKEVTEIRNKIKEAFSNLEFIENGHKYYLHKKDGSKKEMTSVTTFCHQQFEPFVDWEEILERKSLRIGMDKEELRREWKENNILSTSNGSLTHLFAEGYMYFFLGEVKNIPSVIKKMQYEDGFLIPYGNKQMAIAKYYEDLFQTEGLYPVMPEAQIYIDSEDNPYGINADISGTFDALFAFQDKQGKWKLSVRDWKTNKALTNDYNQSNGITLLKPFDTLDYINEPKSVYTIQLSLYSIALEKAGFNVIGRRLVWLKDEGKYEIIPVKYMKNEILSLDNKLI